MNQISEPSFELDDYDEDIDPIQDWVHIDDLEKYDDAKEWINEIIHQFYNIGNVDALENALDELACIFELKLPQKQPKLVKGKEELYDFAVHLNHSLSNLSKVGE